MRSRTENSARNFITEIIAQITAIILNFISRTIFIRVLGEDYLGINGLFSNIITVFSLAELGISTAIIYSLYKPIAENDYRRISALINYFKRLYRIIALIITIIGFMFYPFLDFFINLNNDIPRIRYYYVLFLVQTVSSYLIIYKTSILTADQKGYLIVRNNIFGNFLTIACQIIILIVTHSYGLYIIAQIGIGLTVNYINSKVAIKHYPYILEKYNLSSDEKKDIWINIKSMFSYKVGGVILNDTDNLLISKMISTTVLGIYSNYSLIISKVANIVNLFFVSIQASLGNYNAEHSEKDLYFMFNVISFIEYWIYSICSIAFCLLMDDFICFWIGEKYVLAEDVLYTCVLNFYIQGVLYPIWCYRNTTGLFKDTKFMMYFAAGINLVFSIVLGMMWGLVGIFISTAIARICTNLWYEPYILFKKYFKVKVYKYYLREIGRFVKIVSFIILSKLLFLNSHLKYYFLGKILYCILVPNLFLWMDNRNGNEYIYICERAKEVIKKRLNVICSGNKI